MAASVLQRAPDEPLVTVENDLKEAMASLRGDDGMPDRREDIGMQYSY